MDGWIINKIAGLVPERTSFGLRLQRGKVKHKKAWVGREAPRASQGPGL